MKKTLFVLMLSMLSMGVWSEDKGEDEPGPKIFEHGEFIYEATSDSTVSVCGLIEPPMSGYDLVIPDTIIHIVSDRRSVQEVHNYSVTAIADGAFMKDATELGSITLPEGLVTIGNNAFYNALYVTSIDLPSTLKSLGYDAFSHCRSLTMVRLPDGLTEIGGQCFSDCDALSYVFVPSSLTTVGQTAFKGCLNLRQPIYSDWLFVWLPENYEGEYTIPDGITRLASSCCYICPGLTRLVIPASVTTIDRDVFGIGYLEEIVLPEHLSFLPRNILNSSNLKSVDIPASVVVIDSAAITGTALTSVTIPRNVKKVCTYGFISNTSLRCVNIMGADVSVDEDAFSRCTALEEVRLFCGAPPVIDDKAFPDKSKLTLRVQDEVIDYYRNHPSWQGYRAIESLHFMDVVDTSGNGVSVTLGTASDIELSDDCTSLIVGTDTEVGRVSYTRSFTEEQLGQWQAWSVPFDVDYSSIKDKVDVGFLLGILTDWEDNCFVAFYQMNDGILSANTPYVIRPRSEGDLTVTATELRSTDCKPYKLQTAWDDYTFCPLYTATRSGDQKWYAVEKDNQIARQDPDFVLQPFRWWMTCTERPDNIYVQSASHTPSFRLLVSGSFFGFTAIDNISDAGTAILEQPIYDLQGRPVNHLTPGQTYIVAGQKFMAR